jgi:hypothetical protein
MPEQRPVFVDQYNRSCFLFDHRLHENDIFDLPNLVKLAERLPESYWSTTETAVSSGWGGGAAPRRSLPETVANLAGSNSLVLLKGLADDPAFGTIYHDVLQQFEAQVGDALRADVSVGRATLILSSPGRITPYHIDAEVNFLLQLRGTKIVNIFDPNDRTLLSDEELEAFYSGDFDAAKYKQERQGDAQVFDFRPGSGLHLPLHAPHWTANGDNVSVALSLNCSLRSNQRTASIYRLNGMLRKRGYVPTPPGVSPWQDNLKVAAAKGLDYARLSRLRMRARPPLALRKG